MKKMVILMMACMCLISCSNDDDGPSPKRKDRVDIPLTRGEEQIVTSNNEFAFNLFHKIAAKEKNANPFISPLSVNIAFSMLDNGATGITKKEIEDVLGYKDCTMEEINAFYKKILDASVDIDPQVKVSMANSIWVNNGFPVLPSFTDVNKKSYDAEVKNLDFSQYETLSQINQWVSGRTNGLIPKMLDRLEPHEVIYLINALYFKGEWFSPFQKSSTKDEYFTNLDGSKTKVPMMNRSMSGVFGGNERYSITALPYGNGAFQMVFVLPDEGVELASVIPDINDSSWQDCMLRQGVDCTIKLKMPRFKISYSIKMNEILKDMGMRSAFDSKDAEFSQLSNVPIYITTALQRAQIEVNEEGTEAAASTAVGGMVTSPGPPSGGVAEFYMDRPFMYFIREISTGTIFFMGKIDKM